MSYISTVPSWIRIALILAQTAAWMALAAAFSSLATSSKVLMEFYDLRTSFLIVLVIGTVLSICILVLGLEDMLPDTLIIIFSDLLWVPVLIILSSIAAIEETKYYYFSTIINQGAFAVAAAFGYLSAILYLADAIYYLFFDPNLNIIV